MAKSMMLENVAVLEMTTNEGKTDGKPNGKKFHSLVCYEFGTKYPELIKMNIGDDNLSAASALVGKRCSLVADIVIFKDKMSLYFNQGSAVQK